VQQNSVDTVIEYGCGDGNQLTLANYPHYLGFDISPDAIKLCKEIFSADSTKGFYLMSEYQGQKADLTLSLDVIYHLVEDHVFEQYIRLLFDSSRKYVIIYSTDFEAYTFTSPHVRHRKFTTWVKKEVPGWLLIEHIHNPYAQSSSSKERSSADFFIYQKNG
jgi:SAM-dependent methyltransferase